MIHIYNINQAKIWDNIVKSFAHYDVYYLSGYVKAFQIHGDGEPQLLYYETNVLKAIYVYMKRETAIEGYYDSISPYGYGGVLFEGDTCEKNLRVFLRAFVKKMQEERIVDNFVRYHPVRANAILMKRISTVIDLGRTVAIDLASPEVIWEGLSSTNRNMIRKAIKNNVKVLHGKGLPLLNDFKRIYDTTMEKDKADKYYFFGEDFYKSIHDDLYDNYEVFYAVMNDKIIAMSIMLFASDQLHYHLSGSVGDYRYVAPTNLLLYKAALWGHEHGLRTFHLGGGMGSKEDSLYKFKAAFNRYSNFQFSIGKEIFDQDKYNELIRIRKESDSDFDETSQFFPLYRAK